MDFAAMLQHTRKQEELRRQRLAKQSLKELEPNGQPSLCPVQALRATWHDTKRLTPEETKGCLLEKLPPDVFYYPNLIEEKDAALLITEIEKREYMQLAGRKLQNYGGVPYPSGTILEPLPGVLDALANRLHRLGVFEGEKPPNQSLINKYSPGQGVRKHEDGIKFYPQAACLSLQSSCIMQFHDIQTGELAGRVLLEPNSLVVFTKNAYCNLHHSIEACLTEAVGDLANQRLVHTTRGSPDEIIVRQQRISITMRSVAKVHSRVDPLRDYMPMELKSEMARRQVWWKDAMYPLFTLPGEEPVKNLQQARSSALIITAPPPQLPNPNLAGDLNLQ